MTRGEPIEIIFVKMKKKKGIIISAMGTGSFSKNQINRINNVLDVKFHAQLGEMKSAEFIDLCKDVEVIGVTRRPFKKLEKNIIESLPDLKSIAVYTTGYDWIDTESLQENNIILSYLPDYSTITVAEHTMAMMFTMSRRTHLSFDKVRGNISDDISLRGWELRNKTVGIVGWGKIGQEVGRLSKAMGMNVIVNDIEEINSVNNYTLDDLLSSSDIVVLTASKIRYSPPIIGTREISLMRDGAYLINPSRIDLVDNRAVLKGIKSKKLAGYGVDDSVDLFLNDKEVEPGRIFQTGHTAWYSTEAIKRGTEAWVENIISLSINEPKNIVEVQSYGKN